MAIAMAQTGAPIVSGQGVFARRCPTKGGAAATQNEKGAQPSAQPPWIGSHGARDTRRATSRLGLSQGFTV